MSGRTRRRDQNADSDDNLSGDNSSEESLSEVEEQPVFVVETSKRNENVSSDSVRNNPKKIERLEPRKDPSLVPKSGQFFLHDDRDGNHNSERVNRGGRNNSSFPVQSRSVCCGNICFTCHNTSPLSTD